MSERIETDICVIGGGSGGLSVAAGASQMGADTVLIERGKMGGDCLNYGCVPSKSMLAAGHAAHVVRTGGRFGVDATLDGIRGDGVYGHVQGVIDSIAPLDSVERFTGLGVRVIQGEGKLTGRSTVAVGDVTIQARRIVIATGSGPFVPPIPGLADIDYLTNETVFSRDALPASLIVIGAGPIGIEMAQAHARLGVPVTVLEAQRMMPQDDPELVDVVRKAVVADGVVLREGAAVTAVEKTASGVKVSIETDGGTELIEASDVLVATGRRPHVDGLDLEVAGVEFDRRGIKVDERLRTTNKKIFAIGDCAGGLQFTHVAGYHAGVVIKNALFRLPSKADHRFVPWVTYSDPELANVGLSEEKAVSQEGASGITVLRWPFHENDRAKAEGATEGFAKVITTKKGKILGAAIVGPHAGELILPWCLALSQGLKIGAMATVIAPYPTLSEVSKRAAGSFYTPSLFSDRTKKIVRFLSRFG